jgi:hypothetical protein
VRWKSYGIILAYPTKIFRRPCVTPAKSFEVLERAQRENRIVVTFDKDFGELAFRLRLLALSGVIFFRISAPSSQYVAQAAVTAIASRTDWAGHFAVVEDYRIRITPLPKKQ